MIVKIREQSIAISKAFNVLRLKITVKIKLASLLGFYNYKYYLLTGGLIE